MAPKARLAAPQVLHFFHAIDERLQLPRARGVPQLAQRFRFDLPDTFARYLEALAYLFQGVLRTVFQSEAHLDHPLLARRQRTQNLGGVLLQVYADDRLA